MLAKKGVQRAANPVPEREAAHLGDARAGPRTLLFSQSPQAAKSSIGKPWLKNAHHDLPGMSRYLVVLSPIVNFLRIEDRIRPRYVIHKHRTTVILP